MGLTWKDGITTLFMGAIAAIYLAFLRGTDLWLISSARGADPELPHPEDHLLERRGFPDRHDPRRHHVADAALHGQSPPGPTFLAGGGSYLGPEVPA